MSLDELSVPSALDEKNGSLLVKGVQENVPSGHADDAFGRTPSRGPSGCCPFIAGEFSRRAA
jgi:hypothetical protein